MPRGRKKAAENGSNESAGLKGSNVAGLRSLIAGCAAEMRDIIEERKALNERASEIRERLRDAGVQTAAFDYAMRMQRLEQEARDAYFDTLRVAFEALGIGEQGSLFPSSSGDDDEDIRPNFLKDQEAERGGAPLQ